ncbi:GIY-YIG nuclease family protein [Neolewinella aurantiaca]|uniref:GIY-YIG nuclease family protein n=1 Tax=Neolewinella aurantiaca TaxID=2602767 RepID=A0A5C7FLP4_9BACT|nr:GIY-YIG nuclease family protein [Neolewinella aurantiaca]TXF86316.1 GIY-YIG nuclease family protein [Neolewinella aurantiaca]
MSKSAALPLTFNLPPQLHSLISGPFYSVAEWQAISKTLKKKAGLYTFWWVGDPAVLRGDQLVKFVGPAGENGGTHESCFTIRPENLLLQTEHTCLYVGKSTNLQARIRQHLLWRGNSDVFLAKKQADGSVRRTSLYDKPVSIIYKKNTSCQFRAGMEYLFRQESVEDPETVRRMIRDHVRISYLPISDGAERTDAFKRRFYWEDLLIGVLQPWFNLDGER